MRHLFLFVCLALAALGPARAAVPDVEVAGVLLPERVNAAGRELVLNGAGLRRVLFMGVYVAALYLPEKHRDTREILDRDIPRSLRLTLLQDVSTDQNLDGLKSGLIANNSPSDLQAIGPEVEAFLGYIRGLRSVSANTSIQLTYLPGIGTRVTVNDRYIATVKGEPFNRAVLKIWLGEEPAQASLKRALLGAT